MLPSDFVAVYIRTWLSWSIPTKVSQPSSIFALWHNFKRDHTNVNASMPILNTDICPPERCVYYIDLVQ
jgi:hypothetical protein